MLDLPALAGTKFAAVACLVRSRAGRARQSHGYSSERSWVSSAAWDVTDFWDGAVCGGQG
jgi:hypothetical protein